MMDDIPTDQWRALLLDKGWAVFYHVLISIMHHATMYERQGAQGRL